MSKTRTIHDPFLGKDVQISDRLVDRLRGGYACGPHLPNGNPEFGWRQFQAPPIQHEAAAEIDRLRAALQEAERFMAYFACEVNFFWGPGTPKSCLEQIRAALGTISTLTPADGGGK
jgi:hypothetical protein